MPTVLEQLALYLHEALGVSVAPVAWKGQRLLPHFLKEAYRFSEMELLGTRCLLMFDPSRVEQAPAVICKHIRLVGTRWEDAIVYVRTRLTAYNRKRLVEQKIPFVVPGSQMYLPPLGIDFREHFRRLLTKPVTLGPSAQALVIHVLLGAHRDREVLTPKEMAARLGYSAMTMTRAFDEIEATDLGEVSRSGRQRHLRFAGGPQDLWTRAQPLLRSPVKKRLCIQSVATTQAGLRAGLLALAEYTMLAPPARGTRALSREEWQALRKQHDLVEVPELDPDALEVEVWSYSPAQFSDGSLVDPLSLYLSLKDTDDERVAASLEELLENVKW